MKSKNVILDTLKRIGLGENEAVLYQILLENPKISIANLTKKSPYTRTMLYYIIENLAKMGLIEEYQEQRHKVYEAANPLKLLQMVEEKVTEIRQQKKVVEDLLPDLQSMFRLALNKPNIRFFEGKKGIKAALAETLRAPSKEYMSIVDVDAVYTHVQDINDDAYQKKEKLGFKSRSLIINTDFARKTLGLEKDPKAIDPDVIRLLPAGFTPQKTVMQIYENRVTYYSIRENNKLAVIIEDPDINALHRDIFEQLWKLGAQVTPIDNKK